MENTASGVGPKLRYTIVDDEEVRKYVALQQLANLRGTNLHLYSQYPQFANNSYGEHPEPVYEQPIRRLP